MKRSLVGTFILFALAMFVVGCPAKPSLLDYSDTCNSTDDVYVCNEVWIYQTPSPTPTWDHCEVSAEKVTLRVPPSIAQPDQVRWCVKKGISGQIFISFKQGVPVPLASVSNNQIPVNPTSSQWCSDWKSPTAGPGSYDYSVFFGSTQCADPRLILK